MRVEKQELFKKVKNHMEVEERGETKKSAIDVNRDAGLGLEKTWRRGPLLKIFLVHEIKQKHISRGMFKKEDCVASSKRHMAQGQLTVRWCTCSSKNEVRYILMVYSNAENGEKTINRKRKKMRYG